MQLNLTRALATAVRTAAQAEGFGARRPPTAWEQARGRFKLLPSQQAFLDCQTREQLDCGTFRSGKSVGLCMKVVRRASRPGACEGLFRLEAASLKKTTLKALLEGVGATPPVLQPGTYRHFKSEQEIDLSPSGGGKIQYGGCDDKDRIKSLSLTGAGVDQAEDLTEDQWAELGGRVSVPLPGESPQLYGVCNADHPAHFLFTRFSIENDTARDPTRAYFESSVRENPHVDPGYIAYLESLPPVSRARYLDNKWIAAEGLVYDMWNPTAHIRQRSGPWVSAVLGIDPGYSHRCGMSLILLDADGWRHLAAEVWQEKLVNSQKIEEAQRLRAMAGELFCRTKVDAEDANLIEEMRRAGIPAEPADKGDGSVLRGIGKIQTLLLASAQLRTGENPDDPEVRRRIGRPGWTVDPSCTGWRKEIGAYQWDDKAKRDKPRKGGDDLLDSARYAADAARSDSSGARLRVVRA